MKKIYINIAVADLQKSVKFYEDLGFVKMPEMADENGVGMTWSETIFFMLLSRPFAKNFIEEKEIADMHKFADAIFSFEFESKKEVDEMVEKAKNAGARTYNNTFTDALDFMYSTSVVDPDGHILEMFYMDFNKFPKQN